MVLSTAEKHFLLIEAYFEADEYMKKELGDAASTEFFELVLSTMTKDEYDELLDLRTRVLKMYYRMRYDVSAFNLSGKKGRETLKEIYPDGPPPTVDVTDIPPKTLQTGLMVIWSMTGPIKGQSGYGTDETDEQFERRKDVHDYAFGYVNRDAIEDTLIDKDELLAEFAKQREIISNYVGIIVRSKAK